MWLRDRGGLHAVQPPAWGQWLEGRGQGGHSVSPKGSRQQ